MERIVDFVAVTPQTATLAVCPAPEVRDCRSISGFSVGAMPHFPNYFGTTRSRETGTRPIAPCPTGCPPLESSYGPNHLVGEDLQLDDCGNHCTTGVSVEVVVSMIRGANSLDVLSTSRRFPWECVSQTKFHREWQLQKCGLGYVGYESN